MPPSASASRRSSWRTEDEPFADPRQRPQLELIDDGASVVLFGEEHATTDAPANAPEARSAKSTADYIRRIMDGAMPLPMPIVNEVAARRPRVGKFARSGVNAKPADKPGSVENGHSSGPRVTPRL